MTTWPETPAIRACIAWNEDERKRAMGEVRADPLRVPGYAIKIVRGEKVAMTVDEYRESRQRDADRFARNVKALKERL